MDLGKLHLLLSHFIRKKQGVWYSPEELDNLLDVGSMALFSTLQAKYGTSERIDNSLLPFKTKHQFSHGNSAGGYVTIPSTPHKSLDILDVYTVYVDENNIPRQIPCPYISEEERIYRANSQVIPLSLKDPFFERITQSQIRLYPNVPQAGFITYFRRPQAPKFDFILEYRDLVYQANTSIQLDWGEKDHTAIAMLALESIGISIGSQEIEGFARQKVIQNVTSPIKN